MDIYAVGWRRFERGGPGLRHYAPFRATTHRFESPRIHVLPAREFARAQKWAGAAWNYLESRYSRTVVVGDSSQLVA